jgi:hypothetical protein
MSIKIFNLIDSFFFILCLIPFAIICVGIYFLHDSITNCRRYQMAPDSTYRVGKYLSNR